MADTDLGHREPEDLLGFLVRQAHLRLSVLSAEALARVGIDAKEYGVLRVLESSGPLSQQQIAANLGIDATTMVALVDELAGKDLVTRRPDPADRRRNLIELTASGKDTHRAADAAYSGAEDDFLSPLSAAEAEQFRTALRTLAAPDASLSRGRAAGRTRR